MRTHPEFLTKDFVETSEGLLFALVANGTEQGRVLGTLRYRRTPSGLHKLTTNAALEILQIEFPKYFYHCCVRDVWLAGVPAQDIVQHFRPEIELQQPRNALVGQVASIFAELGTAMGITGSHLIGANRPDSDIDLVVYGVEDFERARKLFDAALASSAAQPLSAEQWELSYQRRGCSELNFDEYLWHETRKRNKFSLNGVKVDLSCVAAPSTELLAQGEKVGRRCIRAKIADDRLGFTSPAVYKIEHATIQTILVFTATYIGQARMGEEIEAAGMLEQTHAGTSRLIIGASREATGDYLKVLRP
jgi:uncharacterized protein